MSRERKFLTGQEQHDTAVDALEHLAKSEKVKGQQNGGFPSARWHWECYCNLRDKLVLNYEPLIRSWVVAIHDRYPENCFDDLMQVAMAACLEKFPKFEPGRGFKISALLNLVVNQTVYRFVFKFDRIITLPTSITEKNWEQGKKTKKLVDLAREQDQGDYNWNPMKSDVGIDPNTKDPAEDADFHCERDQLKDAMRILRKASPVHADVLDSLLLGRNFNEIGAELGEIRQTVQQRYVKAVKILRQIMVHHRERVEPLRKRRSKRKVDERVSA